MFTKKTNIGAIILSCVLMSLSILFSLNAISDETEEQTEEQAEEQAEQQAEQQAEEQHTKELITNRKAIISIIEDKLSTAYSFNSSSANRVPHFEKLDKIFPTWHHGEPAAARQFWLTLNLQAHLVQYRVDYVYMVNDVTAVVEGKRLIVWTRNNESSIIEKEFWPFQYWSNLTHHVNGKCVKCIDVTYAANYTIKLTRNDSNEWIIMSEELVNQPGIPNKWEADCSMDKFLRDWGFKSTCGQKSKTLFGQ